MVSTDRVIVLWLAGSLLLLPNSGEGSAALMRRCEIFQAEYMGSDALELGRLRFELANYLKEHGTGVTLPEGGRNFSIPEEHVRGLTIAFKGDYELAGKANANPLAAKNVGHVNDLFVLEAIHGEGISRTTGVNRAALRLSIAAHDIGKGWLDGAVQSYIQAKIRAAEAGGTAPNMNKYLVEYLMGHEEQSIMRIPLVVEKYLAEQGIDVKGQAGKEMVFDYSMQIIESIRQHNGVDVTAEDLAKKFPSLSSEELAMVRNSFWATNYEVFAKVMGLPKTKYGGDVSPMGQNLNWLDRIALTSTSAPWKLGDQLSGSMDIGINWINLAFIVSSVTNAPLIKADADIIRSSIGNDPAKIAEFNQIEATMLEGNKNLADLGHKLMDMNDFGKLTALNVPVAELPHNALVKGPKLKDKNSYLYYESTTEGWLRIVEIPGKPAIVERRNPATGEWGNPTDQTGKPIDILMFYVAKDGLWK